MIAEKNFSWPTKDGWPFLIVNYTKKIFSKENLLCFDFLDKVEKLNSGYTLAE